MILINQKIELPKCNNDVRSQNNHVNELLFELSQWFSNFSAR